MTAEGQMMTTSQADAVIGQLFIWLYDRQPNEMALSTIACIVCDATSADITCQPLHYAYSRAKAARGIK